MHTIRLDFTGTFEMIDLVQVMSDQLSRLVGLDDEALHWVGVSVRESVSNAIRHGNAGNADKRVHVEFTAVPPPSSGLLIRVRDEGPGFDPASVPDPLAPENLLKPSGRGILLMRNFMDEILIRRAAEGGMEVLMVKRAHAGPHEPLLVAE